MTDDTQQGRTTRTVKNTNCPEVNHAVGYLKVFSRSAAEIGEVDPGTAKIKFNEWSEQDMNPG